MAIRTFTEQERYSRNRGGGPEPRKKLKKLKSVKVANLDRYLRMSMKREKSRFNRSFMASSDDGTEASGSSSAAVSGTSSPNYMRPTSSSSRKGSLQASSGTVFSSSSAKSSKPYGTSKLHKVSAVEEGFDPVGVNIPVEVVSKQKSLKRVTGVKQANKLSSLKSMKIRAKYSQFQEDSSNAGVPKGGMNPEDKPESSDSNYADDQAKQKSMLDRSRTIKMMRLRSKRYSRRLPKSRLSGATEQMPFGGEPHYMMGTSSHEARKNPPKGLTRTTTWKPLRILAKIPSVRQRRNKVRIRPEVLTPLSHTGVGRATCSSALKRSEFPDHLTLNSGGRESEGTSTVHVCPYSYCSLNGHHHHHEPSPPLKEFISAKRQLLKSQKGKQLKENGQHSASTLKTDESRQTNFTDIPTAQMLNPTHAELDAGLDFLITIYAKPRKRWGSEGSHSNDSAVSTGLTYDQTSVTDYDWQLEEAPSTISQPEGRQEALDEGVQEPHEIFSVCNVEANDNNLEEASTTASNEAAEPFIGEEKIQSSADLINVLSDKQKHTNIWHLIYQQCVSTDVQKTGTGGISEEDEKQGGDMYTCLQGNELDQDQSRSNKNLNDHGEDQEAATKTPEFDQTAAIKLVQEALSSILQRDTESVDQQSRPHQNMTNSLAREYVGTPVASKENMKVSDELAGTDTSLATGERLKKVDPCEGAIPIQEMSKSYSKLKRIFMTAKIIKAMERMKKINPRTPRYLSPQPTSEDEKVYLRHLSRNDRKNTEECMLDYALRQVISRLSLDQQRRVAHLVEAFETVSPEQREGTKDYPMKCKPITTSDSATLINEDPEQRISIPDQHINTRQVNEVLFHERGSEETRLREAHVDHTGKTDSPLQSSRNSCKPVDTPVNDGGLECEPMTNPEDPYQSPTGDQVNHAGDMTSIFINKQKYTCMWNLIYQQVASSETSTDNEQGATAFVQDEEGDAANICQEINGPELTRISYDTNHKTDDDDEQAPGKIHQSDQSAAVKLVKEALNSILQRYEQSCEHQTIPFHQIAPNTDESPREDGNHVEKQTNPEGEEKLHLSESKSHSHQQVEPKKLKSPPREMSQSYNRLKRAFVTAKFIKAIEKLRINSPRKSEMLPSEADLMNEKVYLRHLSIDGRKMDEECMLDYALRQVISKMAPDQQRRVVQLVEAFETVTPQQKEKSRPQKSKAASEVRFPDHTSVPMENLAENMHQLSIFDEEANQVPEKQDNGVLLSAQGGSYERSREEFHDCQANTAGDIILQKRTLGFTQSSLTSTPADVAAEVSSIGVEEIAKDAKISSCFPANGSEVKSRGDIATILSEQNYTSMWHLIHQQVVSSETSKVTKQEADDVDEEERQHMNDPESTQMSYINKSSQVGKDEDIARNQSAAIKLVREAIDAILQSHEQKFDQQPLEYDDNARDHAEKLDHTSPAAPLESFSQESKNKAENHRNPELEDSLHEVENTCAPLQEQAGANEGKTGQKKMTKGNSKLRKMIVTAKFIAAMERLRKTNWRKPQHLSPEEASEEERVYLRHLSIRGTKNDEQWMLDYALRNVISSLAPDQQRKVAGIIEAFETVKPGLKGNGVKFLKKDECDSVIESENKEDKKGSIEPKKSDSTPFFGHNLQKQDDSFGLLKGVLLERPQQEDCGTETPNFVTDLSSATPGSDDIVHAGSKDFVGCKDNESFQTSTVKKNVDFSTISESLQHASSGENHQLDQEPNIAKSIVSDKQKTTSMWHLIYKHAQSATSAEDGSKLDGEFGSKYHIDRDDSAFQVMANADNDDVDDNDSDASSVTSELTEDNAMKLVKEAINDILDVPQDQDEELLVVSIASSSALNKDQSTAGQKPEKSLSRGYSKLRQLIICNKFIKTMQKMRKIHPRKQKIPTLYSGAEARKAQLKTGASGEKKGSDEWMLDNVLQKAISELAPAQQRRVALLVKAFENVNPDQAERGTGLTYTKKEPADDISLAGDANGNGDTVSESSHHSHWSPDDSSPNLDRIETTFSMKSGIDMVPQDIREDGHPSLRKEHVLNGNELTGDHPVNITALPSAANSTPSDTLMDPTEVSCGDKQGVPLDEMEVVEKQSVEYPDEASKVANQDSLPEGLKDEGNHIVHRSTSLDRENYTSLWGLILQHANTDIQQEVGMKSSPEIDTESSTDNSAQLSPEVIHDKDKDTDISTATSFDVRESEAIKLVQEAINELLTPPEQTGDNQSMSNSTDQAVSNQVHGNGRDTLSPEEETTQGETSMDNIAILKGKVASPRENLSSTYSQMSKVIMCKRFIKAMDKMRQLKPQPPRENSRTAHTEAEGTPSLRRTAAGQKNSWEEGMLDHALQQVVGKLAPAQKKRVTLLVQAFETVSSQPEPTMSWRSKSSNISKT